MTPSESTPDLESAVEEFIRVARRAADRGLQSGTGGNISLRCGSRFLIKASGCSLYGLERTDIVVLGEDAAVLAGSGKPSKEAGFHLAIYRARPEIGGIAHYHAPFATAYAVKGAPIPRVTIHSKRYFPRMPVVRELPDGSRELADAVVEAFQDREVRLILLAAHGFVAIGRTLTEAHGLAELAEETARTAFVAQRLADT
ncbi:MAG: class II aldolase/adducin family protein [Deltaproteobacteria bacterium]|nr:class II aldolase/adducin family protein [Deltaproteobacteria bacterium]